MNIRRCPYWLLAALWVAVLGYASQSLHAQSSLPQDIIQAKAQLTIQEQATVSQYLDTYVEQLQSEQPSEVAQARSRLTDPIGLSNSDFFKDFYLAGLAQRITPLIDPNEPLMTRLNVAIISAKLTGQELVAILQASANDPSPAVRYWICKSVGKAAKAGAFDAAQQKDVLTVLADRLKAEDASLVLEQVLIALAEINLSDASKTVLEGLHSRVSFHKQNPDARFKPVQNGMQQLWSKLIAERTDGQNVTKELYDLGRSAYRYYALIAEQMPEYELATDEADIAVKSDKAQMASRCVQVMTYVVQDVANQNAPLPVNTNIAAELAASRELWREIFKGPPFNFSDEELSTEE